MGKRRDSSNRAQRRWEFVGYQDDRKGCTGLLELGNLVTRLGIWDCLTFYFFLILALLPLSGWEIEKANWAPWEILVHANAAYKEW